MFENLIRKYYFEESFCENDDISRHIFLENKDIKDIKNIIFCAPELSNENNPAIDVPFFWCMGQECFHNNLWNQSISEMKNWHTYSLYHLIEIIGYPKLKHTVAGYAAEETIRTFIAVVNRAIKVFRVLKCRECGHIMFPYKNRGFNRYYYYYCSNPKCSENGKVVYLNYCYKCGKGIIDSRDTNQCSNGMYICPECFSCCDDALYERLAQKYNVNKRPVPERIKKCIGHGHNNKGDYYCPKCGFHIKIKVENKDNKPNNSKVKNKDNKPNSCPHCGYMPTISN